MPEISRFLGIVVAMFYRDHAPPHFHAYYGDYEITMQIAAGTVEGDFPRRALAHLSSGVAANAPERIAGRLGVGGVAQAFAKNRSVGVMT